MTCCPLGGGGGGSILNTAESMFESSVALYFEILKNSTLPRTEGFPYYSLVVHITFEPFVCLRGLVVFIQGSTCTMYILYLSCAWPERMFCRSSPLMTRQCIYHHDRGAEPAMSVH